MAQKTHNAFWKQHGWQFVGISILFFILTIPLLTLFPFNWDAAQFVLAVNHYDITIHQPHPPGYPLFILAGKILSIIMQPHTALLMVSVVFALGSCLGMYWLVYQVWKKRWLASVVTFAWMLNPAMWFYRETALTYTVDACASVIVAILALYAIRTREAKYMYATAIALALFGGFRPSLVILLVPVLALQWLAVRKWKLIITSIGILGIGCVAWYAPMVYITGGYELYSETSRVQFEEAASAGSVLYGATLERNIEQVHFVLYTLAAAWNVILLPMVLAVIAWLYQSIRKKKLVGKWNIGIIISLAIMPLLIFGGVHIGQLGYVIILLPIGYIITGWLIMQAMKLHGSFIKIVLGFIASILLIIHAGIFLVLTPGYTHPEYIPQTRIDGWLQKIAHRIPQTFKFNAQLLENSDAQLEEIVTAAQEFSPEETLIITGRNIVYPSSVNGLPIRNDEIFRELSAALPGYTVVQIASDVPGYLYSKDNVMTTHSKKKLLLPSSIQHVIIAVEQIPDSDIPEDITLQRVETQSGKAFYTGTMEDSFSFYQITIQHERNTN